MCEGVASVGGHRLKCGCVNRAEAEREGGQAREGARGQALTPPHNALRNALLIPSLATCTPQGWTTTKARPSPHA